MSGERTRVESLLRGPIISSRAGALPDRPYVSLTEALTWIAFGVPLDSPDFHAADEHGIGPFADRSAYFSAMQEAVSRYVEKTSGGIVAVRGRYVKNYTDYAAAFNADTQNMTENQCRDFALFDSLHGGLQRGQGTIWECSPFERLFSGPMDGWHDVEVARSDLQAAFPPGAGWRPSNDYLLKWCTDWLSRGTSSGENKAWPDFRDAPGHAGLSREDVFRPAFRAAKRGATGI